MTTHQFFIEKSRIGSDGRVTIEGVDLHHIKDVLRLRKNSTIHLVDEDGTLHRALIESLKEKTIIACIMDSAPAISVGARLTLVQGIPRLPKADLIAQKVTELGAERIVFMQAARSPYRDAHQRMSGRLARLRTIAAAAAKQSARRTIPSVDSCPDLRAVLEMLGSNATLLVADETEEGGTLRGRLANVGKAGQITVFVGPEGGFSDDERSLLREAGALPFSLGRGVLRSETAAIVAVAIVLYELGEM
jgi:16S rRNA (uracil1498-N3)-methyltransferase